MICIRSIALLAGTISLAACNMAPKTIASASDSVAPQWPGGAAYPADTGQTAGMTWQALAIDPALHRVIEAGLAHNQDLFMAVANVASARAQYRVQRSYQLPAINAQAGATIQRPVSGNGITESDDYSGTLGISGFELDLWGRRKNLSRAAFEQYLASESGAKATKLSVVAEIANAYVTLATDRDLLSIAEAYGASGARTLALTEDLHRNGLVSGADVANARTVLEQANVDIARYTTQVAQDRNALHLLVGREVADADLPASLTSLEKGIGVPQAGLSSQILLSRPDVVEAEHQLRSANFNIGAARAAFFPTISLTSLLGFASPALSGLFSNGSTYWTASAGASIPLLGGATRGNLAYSKAQRDFYLASYRKTAQTAYRDVADALARRGTIDRQREAQDGLVAAAEKSYRISDMRYREGIDSFLSPLVAQRTLYSARQAQAQAALADFTNRIALYSAIGADPTL